MTSHKVIEQVKFELSSATTWGVKKDKHECYSIPVVLDDETAGKIEDLALRHNTKNPLHGDYNTIYLRSKNLSPKQKTDLLNKGKSYVEVHFVVEGVNTNYLLSRVTRLRKVEKPEYDDPPRRLSPLSKHLTKDHSPWYITKSVRGVCVVHSKGVTKNVFL